MSEATVAIPRELSVIRRSYRAFGFSCVEKAKVIRVTPKWIVVRLSGGQTQRLDRAVFESTGTVQHGRPRGINRYRIYYFAESVLDELYPCRAIAARPGQTMDMRGRSVRALVNEEETPLFVRHLMEDSGSEDGPALERFFRLHRRAVVAIGPAQGQPWMCWMTLQRVSYPRYPGTTREILNPDHTPLLLRSWQDAATAIPLLVETPAILVDWLSDNRYPAETVETIRALAMLAR